MTSPRVSFPSLFRHPLIAATAWASLLGGFFMFAGCEHVTESSMASASPAQPNTSQGEPVNVVLSEGGSGSMLAKGTGAKGSAAKNSVVDEILALDSQGEEDTPALVVVVSVDQWAYEYFERFRANLSPDGIAKRTQRDGTWYANCLHQHAFTYTGPGHSVLLTGTYPDRNGIIDNTWYDRTTSKSMYCVADPDATLIGDTKDAKVSPKNLLVETVGDTLKLATHGKSKVYTIAIKDRAAILMGGHMADTAFWMSNAGNWITCDHYMDKDAAIPGYLRTLDIKRYAGAEWGLLLRPGQYQHGAKEDSTGERPGYGISADFPHVIPAVDDKNFVQQVTCSPFGSEFTLDAAQQIIINEQLGTDEFPDILGINLSSTDYVGHAFGPESLEVEDMAYRTDIALGDFAEFLQTQLPGKRWVMFVTADHGVAPVPERAAAMGLDAKRDGLGAADAKAFGNIPALRDPLEAYLRAQLNVPKDAKPLVQAVVEGNVYLQRDENPALAGAAFETACALTRDWLLKHEAIAAAATRADLLNNEAQNSELHTLFRHAFNPPRSGDVLFAAKPYYIQGSATATHGSPWLYDRHVPLMVLSNTSGSGHGRVERVVSPASIAPTIAHLLHIAEPAACEVESLQEVKE